MLLISGEKMFDTIDPSFFYGKNQVSKYMHNFPVLCTFYHYLKFCKLCVLCQIICTTVVVALSILLGGGSLVCLSRGIWAKSDQMSEGSSTVDTGDDLVTEVEPETQTLVEPGSLSTNNNTGTAKVILL